MALPKANPKGQDMLPVVSNLKTKLIAGAVAVALLATSAAPALAWNRDDQSFACGAGVGLLLGYGFGATQPFRHGNNNQGCYNCYGRPVYQQPVYQQPVYQQPVYVQPPVYQQSIYNTPAAYAFQNYSWNERRRIQATLSNYGYYHGGLDGNFGPSTYDAIARYARNTGRMQFLGSQAGSAQLFDGLLS
jgi:hypothetical protein